MRSAQEVSDVQTLAEPSAPFVPYGERLVVAPCDGKFVPLPPDVFTAAGQWVAKGSRLGEVHSGGKRTPVCSGFQGWVMGALAVPGQPVHRGDALFWIWSS
jgi:biotin carboxyl carrier protein